MPKMRNFALCLALAGAPNLAAAVEPGWYLGGFASLSGAESGFDYSGGSDTAEHDLGWGAGAAIGYRFASGLAAEFELAHRSAKVSNVDTSISSADGGRTHVETAMANLIYAFDTGTRVSPYLGVGLGIAYVRNDLVRTVAGDSVHDEAAVAAAQGILGLAVTIAPRWEGFVDYRYLRTAEYSTSTGTGVGIDADTTAQSLNLGARYHF